MPFLLMSQRQHFALAMGVGEGIVEDERCFCGWFTEMISCSVRLIDFGDGWTH